MPNALIFGATGQDGAYLARLLLEKGYAVTGVHPQNRAPQTEGLHYLKIAEQVKLVSFDFESDQQLTEIIEAAAPDEIYNLAAQSSVAESFVKPVETGLVNGIFLVRLLEAIRKVKPDARLFQASSAEIFGAADGQILNEETPLRPSNPYGTAKAYAHHMVRNYREAFGLHAGCGILFTHESPLRGAQFVSRKITLAAARIKLGLQTELVLGNTDVSRDWGYAVDFVESMWLMLQQPQGDDFIIATGHQHSLYEWAEQAFQCAGLRAQDYVRSDEQFKRPVDSLMMRADPSKARRVLGWTAKMSFEKLVEIMVEADLQRLQNEK